MLKIPKKPQEIIHKLPNEKQEVHILGKSNKIRASL